MSKRRVVIMGAAGRDFHNFNCLFRENPSLTGRGLHSHPDPRYRGSGLPAELAGPPTQPECRFVPEEDLESIVRDPRDRRGLVLLLRRPPRLRHGQGQPGGRPGGRTSESAPSSKHHDASRPNRSWRLQQCEPVWASRRPAGISRESLREMGFEVVAIRHPMPYGDLSRQICQRFANYDDLDTTTAQSRSARSTSRISTTVSWFTPESTTRRSLREAEQEADLILWDGGNNDTPFYARPAHHPGRPTSPGP